MSYYTSAVTLPSEVQKKCADFSCALALTKPPVGITNLIGSGTLTQYIPSGSTCPVVPVPCTSNVSCPPIFTGILMITNCCNYRAFDSINFINGDLYITDTTSPTTKIILEDIFPNLIGINGNLIITTSTATVIDGFRKLKWVQGDIYIGYNANLVQIPDFNCLNIVGSAVATISYTNGDRTIVENIQKPGRIIIDSNPLLRQVSGFDNLRQVAGGIFINNNICMNKITGFDKLYSTPTIFIHANSNLCLIFGFGRISVIINLIIVYNNHSGHNKMKIDAFNSLCDVQEFQIIDNHSLTDIRFDSLESFHNIFIICNYALENVIFKKARTGNNIEIGNNPKLSVILFDELHSLSKSLIILSNHKLVVLSSFDKLERVGQVIRIEDNSSLVEIKGFKHLKYVGQYTSGVTAELTPGACTIITTGLLPPKSDTISCDDPQAAFTSIVCTGFADIPVVINTCSVDVCGAILISLASVIKLATTLDLPGQFENELCLTNTCGTTPPTPPFPFARISYSIVIYNNPLLKIVDAFQDIETIESSLYVVDNENLTVFRGFDKLIYTLDIVFSNNTQIKAIFGFKHLHYARFITIKDSPCLEIIDSFEGLKVVQIFEIVTKSIDSLKHPPRQLPSVLAQNVYYSF